MFEPRRGQRRRPRTVGGSTIGRGEQRFQIRPVAVEIHCTAQLSAVHPGRQRNVTGAVRGFRPHVADSPPHRRGTGIAPAIGRTSVGPAIETGRLTSETGRRPGAIAVPQCRRWRRRHRRRLARNGAPGRSSRDCAFQPLQRAAPPGLSAQCATIGPLCRRARRPSSRAGTAVDVRSGPRQRQAHQPSPGEIAARRTAGRTAARQGRSPEQSGTAVSSSFRRRRTAETVFGGAHATGNASTLIVAAPEHQRREPPVQHLPVRLTHRWTSEATPACCRRPSRRAARCKGVTSCTGPVWSHDSQPGIHQVRQHGWPAPAPARWCARHTSRVHRPVNHGGWQSDVEAEQGQLGALAGPRPRCCKHGTPPTRVSKFVARHRAAGTPRRPQPAVGSVRAAGRRRWTIDRRRGRCPVHPAPTAASRTGEVQDDRSTWSMVIIRRRPAGGRPARLGRSVSAQPLRSGL